MLFSSDICILHTTENTTPVLQENWTVIPQENWTITSYKRKLIENSSNRENLFSLKFGFNSTKISDNTFFYPNILLENLPKYVLSTNCVYFFFFNESNIEETTIRLIVSKFDGDHSNIK